MAKDRWTAITGKPATKRTPSPAGGVRIETFTPWTLVKRGVRCEVMTPIGAPVEFRNEAQRAKRDRELEQHSPLLRALGLAHYWQQLLDDGTLQSITEIAAAEGMDVGRVSRILRLAQLSPAINSANLAGTPNELPLDTAFNLATSIDWNLQQL